MLTLAKSEGFKKGYGRIPRSLSFTASSGMVTMRFVGQNIRMFVKVRDGRGRLFAALIGGMLLVIGLLAAMALFSCKHHVTHIAFMDHGANACPMYSLTSVPDKKHANTIMALPDVFKRVFVSIALFFLLTFTWRRIVWRSPPWIKQRERLLAWVWAKATPFLVDKNYLPYFLPVQAI